MAPDDISKFYCVFSWCFLFAHCVQVYYSIIECFHFTLWNLDFSAILCPSYLSEFDTGICISTFPYIYPHTHHYRNSCHNMAWSTPMYKNPMILALLCRCSRRNSWQNKETGTAGKYTVNAHILDGYIKQNIILERRYTQLFRPVGSLTQVKNIRKRKIGGCICTQHVQAIFLLLFSRHQNITTICIAFILC